VNCSESLQFDFNTLLATVINVSPAEATDVARTCISVERVRIHLAQSYLQIVVLSTVTRNLTLITLQFKSTILKLVYVVVAAGTVTATGTFGVTVIEGGAAVK